MPQFKAKQKSKQNINTMTDRLLILKEDCQEYGCITKLLGNSRLEVNCFDGIVRQCHIRGALRYRSKKIIPEIGDIILISLRPFEKDKADVIHKYNRVEISKLKQAHEIPEDVSGVGNSSSKSTSVDDFGFIDFDDI